MTNTEQIKFENPGSLSTNEIKSLQKLSKNLESLKGLETKQLEELKNSLIKEKEGYLGRATNEKSKKWIGGMIDKIIGNIDGLMKAPTNTTEAPALTNTTEAPAPTDRENTFNKRLEKLLDDKTTLIFKIGNDSIVISFDNNEQKEKAEKFLSTLETSFQDDKLAAYALIRFLKENKDNIKSVTDIYKEAGKGLSGNQLVLAENSNERELALLDAAKKNNITVIGVDKGNSFWNVLGNTFTLNLFNIDTASVGNEILDDNDYGRKITTKVLLNGYTSVVEDSDGNDNERIVQEPLGHFEKDEVISGIADSMEKILKSDLTKEDIENGIKGGNTNMILVKKYLLDHGINIDSLSAVELKDTFKQDETIKKWLNSDNAKKLLKDIIPEEGSDAIEITENGFMSIDEEKLKATKYINVKLDKVGDKGEDKEVLMEVNQLKFTELGLEGLDLSNIPPMVLEDGTIFTAGKEGIYILGKGIGNGADAVKDYLERHEIAAAALAGGIIGALLVKGIKLPEINLDSLARLGEPFEKLGKSIQNGFKDLEANLPNLNTLFAGYLLTSIPLNYKIDGLENKIAELKAKYEGSDSIDSELDAITGKEINTRILSDIDNYDEAANRVAHYALVKQGVFNPGEGTSLVFERAERDGDNYKITAISGNLILGNHTFKISDGDRLTLIIDKNGNIQNMEGQLTEEVIGKDNKIKIQNTEYVTYIIGHTFGRDKKKRVSFDLMRHELDKKN